MLPKTDVVVFDVGARGGGTKMLPHWISSSRLFRPYYEVMTSVGFEADALEVEELRRGSAYDVVANKALSGTGGQRTLHLTREAPCSSILEPDPEIIRKVFAGNAKKYDVVHTRTIATETLDQAAVTLDLKPDWLKIDVQGAEHEILAGGPECLQQASVLLLELSSVALYKNQPIYPETMTFLVERGFEVALCNYKPVLPCEHDFLFIRNFWELTTARQVMSVLLALSLFGLDKQKADLVTRARTNLSEGELLSCLTMLARIERMPATPW